MYWIGLSEIQGEGRWSWSDSSKGTYRNWGTGEPNNASKLGEDCTVINRQILDLKKMKVKDKKLLKDLEKEMLSRDSKWIDISCSSRLKFVCSKMVQVPLKYRDWEYLVRIDRKAWPDAEVSCN